MATEFAVRWSHVTPWIQPVWMDSWSFASFAGGVLVLVVWLVAELVSARKRVVGAFRSVVADQ